MKSLKEKITESLQVNEQFKDYNGYVYKPIKFNDKTIKPLDDEMAGTVYYKLTDEISLYDTIGWDDEDEIPFVVMNDEGDVLFEKVVDYKKSLSHSEVTKLYDIEINKILKDPKFLKLI